MWDPKILIAWFSIPKKQKTCQKIQLIATSLIVENGQGKQGIQRFCIPKKICTPPNNMYNKFKITNLINII
jgi:hypothetical protein